ncbi:MAG: ComEC family competence protein [Clostridium sp.]|nr:ComEC family competence protein [Prevotella sp.]MCM1429179.1 ComEC family competence protein [Clostridium sp.]MCM1475847.1 ComEC family competence protein [Muribaculaceae bacterium]
MSQRPPFPQQYLPPMAFVVGVVVVVSLVVLVDLPNIYLYGAAGVLEAIAISIYIWTLMKTKTAVDAVAMVPLHWTWSIMAFFALGIGATAFGRPESLPEESSGAMAVGVVEKVGHSTSGDRLTVNVERFIKKGRNTSLHRNLKVVLITDAILVRKGDRIAFKCDLEPPTDNPNFISGDYARYMRLKGIVGEQHMEASRIYPLGHQESLSASLSECRDKLEIFIENSGLQHSTSDFLITMLLGDGEYMDTQMRDGFSEVGLAHILAVSGMHVGIIATIILVVLFPLNFFFSYKLRYLLAIPIIWVFVFLTGLGPSALRAALMLTLSFMAILLERKNSSLMTMLWAMFFILLFSPFSLLDPGFQLSFICVGGLVAFANPLNPIDLRHHHMLSKLVGLIIATVVATAASWLIAAYHFGRVPLMFLPANLPVLPLLPLFVGVVVFFLLLSAVGLPSLWLARIIDGAHDALLSYTRFVGGDTLSSLTLDVGALSAILWTIGIGLLIPTAYEGRQRRGYLFTSVIILVLSIATIPMFRPYRETDGYIIRNSYQEITIANYHSREQTILDIPRGTISGVELYGDKIVSVDLPVDRINELPKDADIIIIGSGYRGSLTALDSIAGSVPDVRDASSRKGMTEVRNRLYILHNSLRKRRELELTEEAKQIGLNIYSLRRDGPYRIFNKDIQLSNKRINT